MGHSRDNLGKAEIGTPFGTGDRLGGVLVFKGLNRIV